MAKKNKKKGIKVSLKDEKPVERLEIPTEEDTAIGGNSLMGTPMTKKKGVIGRLPIGASADITANSADMNALNSLRIPSLGDVMPLGVSKTLTKNAEEMGIKGHKGEAKKEFGAVINPDNKFGMGLKYNIGGKKDDKIGIIEANEPSDSQKIALSKRINTSIRDMAPDIKEKESVEKGEPEDTRTLIDKDAEAHGGIMKKIEAKHYTSVMYNDGTYSTYDNGKYSYLGDLKWDFTKPGTGKYTLLGSNKHDPDNIPSDKRVKKVKLLSKGIEITRF